MKEVLNIKDIMNLIPHRYPFLLVDKVEVNTEERKAIGYKNVTINEPFFVGHFPGEPIMPGVLILEALAQTGGILIFNEMKAQGLENKLILFAGMDKVKFRNPVVPGDVLRLEIDVLRFQGKIGKQQCKAYVGDKLVAEAIQTSMVVDKE